jgi:hypothetical protein
MNETIHIHKAIEIIQGIIKGNLRLFEERVSIAFNSLNLPNNLDLDQFLSFAKQNRTFTYNGKDFPYDNRISCFDNLQNWAFNFDTISPVFLEWKGITKTQQLFFWEILGRFSYFERDSKTIFEEFEKDFFYHINKSLLNAEYLFLDNYKQIVQECAKSLLEKNTENQISYNVPRFIKSFIIIASHLCDLCWRIDNAIDEKNNRRIEIETHAEEKANRLERYLKFCDPSAYHDILFHFTQSVIEMTAIDHIYKASSENISKLITLWVRIKDVEEKAEGKLLDMIRVVKSKTATLLYQMLEMWRDNEKIAGLENVVFFYSAGTENNLDINSEIKTYKLPCGLNQTILKKNSFKDKDSHLDNYPQSVVSSNNLISNDIKRYNNWVKRGQEYYCVKSGLIGKIIKYKSNQTPNLEGIIDEICNFNKEHITTCEYFSPYFFLLVLDFIDDNYKDKMYNELTIKLLSLLQSTLSCLKEYINTYENRMPPVFRPYFEYSFYQYRKNNKCISLSFNSEDIEIYDPIREIWDNSFFFASYECNAISINRLKEKYEKYIVLFTSWSSCFSQYLQNKSSELEKSIDEQKKQLEKNIEDIEKKIIKQEEDAEDQKAEIKRTQQSSLQTLGLFTGFLAFIVTSIGTFRVANNTAEYIIYSLTYTLAIALFAFLISDSHVYFSNKSENKEGKKKRIKMYLGNVWKVFIGNGKTLVFGIIFFFLLLFAVCYFSFYGFSSTKETTDATDTKSRVSVTIDNTSASSTILNMQDVNQNDTLKATANISDNAEIANGADSVDDNNNTDSVP